MPTLKLFPYMFSILLLIGCSLQPETQETRKVSTLALNLSFNIKNKTAFKNSYKNIVKNISDLSEIKSLRINKSVSIQDYFIVTLEYYSDQVKLVFRTKDYYLMGFIGKSNTYWHFSDATILNIPGVADQKNLGYSGSYISISFPGVFTHGNLISHITTLNIFNGIKPNNLKKVLSTIIFITAETFRFKTVSSAVLNLLGTSNSVNSAEYENDIKNWATLSTSELNNVPSAVAKVHIAKKY